MISKLSRISVLLLVCALAVLAQSGGMINGTRGTPQPNDGTTGTVLSETAIINSSGNAITAGTSNTAVQAYIVVGGAGTSGNAVLASSGTLAPCKMDATNASGVGGEYVINSTTTGGDCHVQASPPPAGICQIGTLHDSSTTSASTALVMFNPSCGPTIPATFSDTTTPVTVGGTNSSEYHNNQNATAATAVTYNLPTAAAGLQRCFANSYNGSAANTGVLTIATSASGQFIIFTDGTLSATGGNVTSGGAAHDAACVVGVDSTHWQLYTQAGTWTKH